MKMKVTKEQLKLIIKEELELFLQENPEILEEGWKDWLDKLKGAQETPEAEPEEEEDAPRMPSEATRFQKAAAWLEAVYNLLLHHQVLRP